MNNSQSAAKKTVLKIILYLVLLVFLFVQVYPFFWVITSSLKSPEDLRVLAPYAMPSGLYWGHYASVFEKSMMPRYFLNSLVVAVAALFCIVLLSCPAAYAIDKMRWKWGNKVMGFFLAGIMIPIFATLIPMFTIYNTLGLRNTYVSLILPQIGINLPISIFIYSGFMKYIPDSLIESCILDGASELRVLTSIIFPMSKNTTVTVITYNFIFIWNEFTFANTFMSSNSMKTVPIGLNDFVGMFGKRDWGGTFAAIVLTVLPTLVMYFFLNRNVIEGMSAGALKN